MATCGHCDKQVAGIKDHIREKHGDKFYSMGPDFRFYSYKFLVNNKMIERNPNWETKYD